MPKNVQNSSGATSEWFHCPVLDILWRHFYGLWECRPWKNAIDLFFIIPWKIYEWNWLYFSLRNTCVIERKSTASITSFSWSHWSVFFAQEKTKARSSSKIQTLFHADDDDDEGMFGGAAEDIFTASPPQSPPQVNNIILYGITSQVTVIANCKQSKIS